MPFSLRANPKSESKSTPEEEEESLEDFRLLPPLLNANFGSGLLLQFSLNDSNVDDKWHLLEIGFAIGVSGLVLRIHKIAMIYILESFGPLVEYNSRKLRMVKTIARYTNHFGVMLQALLLLVSCIYCLAISDQVEFRDDESDVYVDKRVYMFTTIISCIMTFCLVEAIICGALTLTSHQLTYESPPSTEEERPHPAVSLINLGSASAFLAMYVGMKDEGFGNNMFLEELCLTSAGIAIYMSTSENILKISLHFAKKNSSILDSFIIKCLNFVRYSMAAGQLIVFFLMFIFSIVAFQMKDTDPDWKVPENILVLCTVVSTLVIGSVIGFIFSIMILKGKRRS